MRLFFRLALLIGFAFIIAGFSPKPAYAQSCSGNFEVGNLAGYCVCVGCANDPANACPCGTVGCNATVGCIGSGVLKSCTPFNVINCTSCHGGLGECCDPSFPQCAWSAGGGGGAICGGGPVSYCNGGASSFYCCGAGQYCNPPNPIDSSFTCSSTPPAAATATPVPSASCSGTCATSVNPGACTTSTGQPGTYQWDGQPSGSSCTVNPNTFCYTCVATAPTSPPSGGGSAPTPTTAPPSGGGCFVCGGGGCCPACAACIPVAGATGGLFCDSSTCPPPGGGAPPPVIPTPTPIPSCFGCQTWNGFSCVDNSGLCAAGQICSGGVCIALTFGITGTVFVDTNKNGFMDAGESAYTLTNPRITLSTGAFTNASGGNYSFNNVTAGTYSLTLTTPAGYLNTSANPASVTGAGGRVTQNFGIVQNPPVCIPASLSASPTTINAGSTSNLSVSSCSNTNNPAVPPANWNPNAGGNPDCSTATITNTFSDVSSATATWNAPACPASNITCSVSAGVVGPGGTTTYTTNINVNATYSVTANVLEDNSNNGCVSGSTAYAGSTSVQLANTGTGATLNQNISGGTTTFTCQNVGNYNALLTVPTGYRVTNRSVSPGPSGTVLNNGVSFAAGPNQTATFCISKINPWFQTASGDVRDVALTNKVPAGLYASSDIVNPSLFISSNWASDFGNGAASALGWKADAEYDYNKNSQNRNGTANYSYYVSKINQTGVSPTVLQNCNSTACNINLATGVYTVNGPITITGYSQVPGAHVVLLVNGDVTIKSNIKVPAGVHNLFILAAKGNVTIDRTVGEAVFNSSATNVEGVITAERSVIADGTQCGGGNSDLRLNIAGTVVANALKPFATAGTGVFTNNRSLCANDITTPVVTFTQRLDFITELTDFYKTINQRWKEVQP